MIAYIDVEATGERINQMRIERGLSLKDISEELGFSRPCSVYRWVKGEVIPKIDNLIILAEIFNCKIDDIIVVKRG